MSADRVQCIAADLVALIRAAGIPAVAFSGGVDSAVVARASELAWPGLAVAVTAVSPSLSARDRDDAVREASAIGIRHEFVETTEFERDEYRRNQADRCYYCKDTLYSLSRDRMQAMGAVVLLNGANKDDRGDYRPGMQAAADHAVRSPLMELELSKADVRLLARFWSLSVADKPASPCLASRIAYGVEVTPERVARVEQAESWIRDRMAGDNFRVRLEAGESARIEVALSDLPTLCSEPCRSELIQVLKRIGFRRVTLDLEGFRSGNLNNDLPLVTLGTPADHAG